MIWLVVVAAVLLACPPAAAAPVVHAHRGGSVLGGRPAFPENSMPAFENAARVEGAVLELDVKLTSDRVPVVIHDDTLDRTTNCSGPVDAIDSARLAAECRVDVLGSPGSVLPSAPAPATMRVPVPRLSDVLALARAEGATVNVEIKNLPTDGDFDPGTAYAAAVVEAIAASGIPARNVIVQSFWPANLDVAEARLPGAATSLLTLPELNEGGPTFAALRGYEWVSPGWPVDGGYVQRAHALGLRVVPYTLNLAEEVRTAAAAGVDALITDDPAMARGVLGLRPRSTAPRLQIVSRRLRLIGRSVRVRVSCSPRGSRCAGVLRLWTIGRRPVLLGRARYSVPSGRRGVAVRIGPRRRALIRRRGQLRVRVRSSVRGGQPSFRISTLSAGSASRAAQSADG